MRYDGNGLYNPITYDFDEIIQRAESGNYLPPDKDLFMASAFASWVFYLCHLKSKPNDTSHSTTFSIAKKRELEISQLLNGLDGCNGFKKDKNWQLIYQDPVETNSSSIFFVAPNLKINGISLKCRPDVVLYNVLKSELLIVERKVAVTSDASVPDKCYPNILAQLWCYSQIDFEGAHWPTAKKVILAADIWTHKRNESELDGGRKIWVWQINDRVFNYIQRLFKIYSRKIESQ